MKRLSILPIILTCVVLTLLVFVGTALAADTTLSGNGPTFTFASTEPGATFECAVDGGAWAACASPHTVRVADGPHTFSVRALDAAGNADATPATKAFDVDTSGLETVINAGPEGLTNDPTPSYGFGSESTGATFECRVSSEWAPCVSPFKLPRLASGSYVFEVRAVVGARKDGSPARRAFTVDADAPETTLTGGPAEGETTNLRSPVFTYASEPGASFECRVDPVTKADVELVAWGACGAIAPLKGGPHTFQVRAVDAAGNPDPTPATRAFKVRACEQIVRIGLAEVRGTCVEGDGETYTSTAAVTVNGLPIPVPAGARFTITEDKLSVTNVTLAVAGIELYKGNLNLALPKGKQGEEKDVTSFPVAGKKLFGMQIGGKATLRFGWRANSDQRYAVLALNVALPDIFKTGTAANATAVTGDVAIRMDAVNGVQLDGLKVDVGNAYIGPLVVEKLCLSYLKAGATFVAGCQAPTVGGKAGEPFIQCAVDTQVDRWDGSLAIVLPTASKTRIGMWGGLSGGQFGHAGAFVDRLGTAVPLAPGVFLDRVALGVCVNPPPLKVKGEVGIGFGPDFNGAKAIGLNGWFQYTGGTPWLIEAGGSLSVFGTQMADATFAYESSGMVKFGFHAGFNFGKAATFDGRVDGWVQTGTPNFNVEGTVAVCNKTLGCLNANAVVSNIGVAGCAGIDTWLGKINVGAGYTFRTKEVSVMLAGCDIGPFRARAAQVSGTTFEVRRKSPAVVVRVRGEGGVPKVALVGPDGRRVTSDVPDGQGFKNGEYMIMSDEDRGAVSVLVASPAAGEWTVEPLPGSVPVAGVDVADTRPETKVKAKVVGKRELRYEYTPQPGERVTFVERGLHTARALGTARAGKHTLRFTPGAGGAGVRNVIAQVTQDGRPRENVKVASFVAPADRLPARPKVKVKRRGQFVRISWTSTADRVDITYRTAAGASKLVAGRKPRGAIRVRATQMTVSVRGLRADGRSGKPTTRKVK
ncbi:hypothetical protein DVA67_026855 [Solirubrobacter sp. CPCC 204708]|uniref:Bacterial Ig-like domain-containing protein n=1 Tax=Solirubrobacter deserti TaxID=2282478 RepID=A0ABT4RGI2_9ACTN|nr:hypothetical protein [Solirubrobacter deserti]MBE2319617.1 hypothetical protein [Solirubrobacter deserti]MDA0137644.1 hypothetical protein [Solirubrobacter deserti]